MFAMENVAMAYLRVWVISAAINNFRMSLEWAKCRSTNICLHQGTNINQLNSV